MQTIYNKRQAEHLCMFRPKFLAFPGKVWEEYVIESDVFSNIQPDLSHKVQRTKNKFQGAFCRHSCHKGGVAENRYFHMKNTRVQTLAELISSIWEVRTQVDGSPNK